ncbi:MAG: class I SAM-dependent methyltransferase [Halanaeroarchaeum sp.]
MVGPQDRRQTIGRFYTRWARAYDLVARRTPLLSRYRRQAVAGLDLAPGDRVVEMGCGTGANLSFLRQGVAPDGAVLGVDLASGPLGRAHRRFSENTSVGLARGDVASPPVCQVDAVLATFVVGLLQDPERAVAAWIDSLTPGGRIALLHATASDRRALAPVNVLYRTVFRLAAPGGPAPKSAIEAHESRIERAHETIDDRCVDVTRQSLAGGYLQLVGGRKPVESG